MYTKYYILDVLRPIRVTAYFMNFLPNSRNEQRHRPVHEPSKNGNKTCPFHEMGNEKSHHCTNGAIDFLIDRDKPIYILLIWEINHFQINELTQEHLFLIVNFNIINFIGYAQVQRTVL